MYIDIGGGDDDSVEATLSTTGNQNGVYRLRPCVASALVAIRGSIKRKLRTHTQKMVRVGTHFLFY